MQPYRKSFAGDPLFPFEIVYKTIKYPDNELPNHLHDHYELVYVHSGQGIFSLTIAGTKKRRRSVRYPRQHDPSFSTGPRRPNRLIGDFLCTDSHCRAFARRWILSASML